MKTVVVYYSRFGTTRTVAKAIAEELGAELREIQAARECGFLGMAFRSLFGIRMPIRPMNLDFTGADQIVLCTPIWAGRPANPVRTFLQEAKLEGKKASGDLHRGNWGKRARSSRNSQAPFWKRC